MRTKMSAGDAAEVKLCSKLYNAVENGSAVTLTYEEVYSLARMDDAVVTRINNAAEMRATYGGHFGTSPFAKLCRSIAE